MRIVNANAELTAKEIYFLTQSPNTVKMKDVKGQRIEVDKWLIYEDVNKKNEELQNILTIMTPDGETFATNSPTFISDFISMWELFTSMGEPVPAIVVTSGTSKANREYITCVYSD